MGQTREARGLPYYAPNLKAAVLVHHLLFLMLQTFLSLQDSFRGFLEGLPGRMTMSDSWTGVDGNFGALLEGISFGSYCIHWDDLFGHDYHGWQAFKVGWIGTEWQHLFLPDDLADMNSLVDIAQYFFVTTILSPILASLMVCWLMEIHYIAVSMSLRGLMKNGNMLLTHFHFLSVYNGGVYTIVNMILTCGNVNTGEDMNGAAGWGVHILTAMHDVSMWFFGITLIVLFSAHGWRQLRQRCSIPLSKEAKAAQSNLLRMNTSRTGLRALIVCTCIVSGKYSSTHYMASHMPPIGNANFSEPCGNLHGSKHLVDAIEGFSSWKPFSTSGQVARQSELQEGSNRACQFCTVVRPQRVTTDIAFLNHSPDKSYVAEGSRCLTRGLGGSYPLTCTFQVSRRHSGGSASDGASKKPAMNVWGRERFWRLTKEGTTHDMTNDALSLMQSSSWKSASSNSGYSSWERSWTQDVAPRMDVSLSEVFWQQVGTIQRQFPDVHLYLHGLKGKHVATRVLTIYGKKKGILPSLHSRIEHLWRDHYDRRESASLHYVDPQPISTAMNGQVHVILDLWPSLQGTPVLSQWTVDDEPGCAVQSHRLQRDTPFDEILTEGDLPREIVSGMKVTYAYRDRGYGRHDVIHYSKGAKFDIDLALERECPSSVTLDGRFVAEFTIDPLQDSAFLMQVRPLMEDMLVRHIRRVRGGNVRTDVLTWMHHAEFIQQPQRDLRIVTHNPD